ncbi:Sm-like protein LSM8 [Glycine soja]
MVKKDQLLQNWFCNPNNNNLMLLGKVYYMDYTTEGVQLVFGLYINRGDNISVVGELDEDLDSSMDFSKLRAHPLKPIIH